MARIVLGIGTSHSPQLSSPPEIWHDHVARDRRNPFLVAQDGEVYSFDDLPLRPEWAIDPSLLTLEVWRELRQRTDSAIDTLNETLSQAAPDVVVVVGDDQDELFLEDGVPAIAIFWGESITDIPPTAEKLEQIPAGIQAAHWAIHAEKPESYPVASGLGKHVVEDLILDEFDVCQASRQPSQRGLGHAFTFVRRRLMRDRLVPLLPVVLNTYVPPNQVSPRRCYALGRALRRAIERYPDDLRVAIVASGGLSHFVVDEALDRRVIDGLARRDVDSLTTIPRRFMRSGSSEILNWIAVGGAVEHLRMEVVDYVPGYRSTAGTGIGACFAIWH
jgi:3-O-methylgallate 3,4-dioxygenase